MESDIITTDNLQRQQLTNYEPTKQNQTKYQTNLVHPITYSHLVFSNSHQTFGVYIEVIIYTINNYNNNSERNTATGIRTRLLRCHSPAH